MHPLHQRRTDRLGGKRPEVSGDEVELFELGAQTDH